MHRIGLFGGSFDPVHNAHLALARQARDELRLDELRWVPAGNPWQKTRPMTPATQRVAMLELAIAGEPRFAVERCELQRQGPSYTLDTVRALQAAHPGVRPATQWVLLIGQDQYVGLHTWNDWRSLLALVELAVANRPGAALQPHADVQRFPHRMVPLPMLDISSTDIRARVAAGQDISQLVPPGVARYIETHGLYRGPLRS